MKRPDLLILIAIWQFITAFLTLAIVTGIALVAFPMMLGVWGPEWGNMWGLSNTPMLGGVFGLSIAIIVLLCYLAIGVVGGIGLLMGQEWGRITSIVHNAISLIFPPIVGTTLGVLSIIYLTKREVKEYFASRKAND
jgi:hypothetical protein